MSPEPRRRRGPQGQGAFPPLGFFNALVLVGPWAPRRPLARHVAAVACALAPREACALLRAKVGERKEALSPAPGA